MEQAPNMQAPGFWRRFGAGFIDYMIVNPLLIYFIQMGGANNVTGVIAASSLVLYYIIFEASRFHGTPGKKSLGLSVVDKEGNAIGPLRSLIRYIIFVLPSAAFKYIMFLQADYTDFESKVQAAPRDSLAYFGIAAVIGMVAFVIWFLPMFFTKQKTTIHDMLTGTRVVWIKDEA